MTPKQRNKNVTIELAKMHLQDKPDDISILRADLIKVIRLAEELLNKDFAGKNLKRN